MSRRTITLATLLAVAALSGCGDDDEPATSASSAGPTPTETTTSTGATDAPASTGAADAPAWTAPARELCKATKAEIRDVATKANAASKDDKVAGARVYVNGVGKAARALVADLRKIDAGQDAQAWSEFLDRLARAFDLNGAIITAAVAGQNKPDLTSNYTQLTLDVRPFAQRTQLTDCLTDTA